MTTRRILIHYKGESSNSDSCVTMECVSVAENQFLEIWDDLGCRVKAEDPSR